MPRNKKGVSLETRYYTSALSLLKLGMPDSFDFENIIMEHDGYPSFKRGQSTRLVT